jgi:hypothetical protein
MNKYFEYFPITFLLFFLTSCSDAGSASPNKTGADNSIVFKINGALVNTRGWNITRFNTGKTVRLNITTNMHEDKRTLLINLNGWTPGNYTLKTGSDGPNTGYGDYKPDYNDAVKSYSFSDGLFTVENIDTVKQKLNASFHGTVTRGNESFLITEGRIINGILQKDITEY